MGEKFSVFLDRHVVDPIVLSAGLQHKQFARLCELPPSTYSNARGGRNMSPETAKKISRGLLKLRTLPGFRLVPNAITTERPARADGKPRQEKSRRGQGTLAASEVKGDAHAEHLS